MSALRSVEALVRGRVQGVFYRASLQREAEARGVAGWVRNRADGAVEFRAEGLPDAVAALLAWAETGPPHAAVTSVRVREINPDGAARGFAVRS